MSYFLSMWLFPAPSNLHDKKKKTLQKRAEGITYEYRIQSLADLGLNPGSSAH